MLSTSKCSDILLWILFASSTCSTPEQKEKKKVKQSDSNLQHRKKWSLGAEWLIAARAHPGFCSMKQLGVFLLPLDGMLVHRRSLPHNLLGFPNNLPVPIYTPGWREALWELSVLLQGHNTVSLARAWTWTARSRNKSTNHEAAAPPTIHNITPCKKYHMK